MGIAGVAKLENALPLKGIVRKDLQVQILPPAPAARHTSHTIPSSLRKTSTPGA